MPNAVPLTFAPDMVGVLRHVDEVENGLACGCLCPSCGAPLVAKQGVRTTHHFAHEGDSDCAGGVETALHLAAKEILSHELRMVVPEVYAPAEAMDSSGRVHQSKRALPAKTVSFESVSAEVRLGGVVPDIVATVGGRTLLIEVAVSHFADDAKKSLLRDLGFAAVEIDLSGMAEGWTWHSLTEAIVKQTAAKKWLFNPKADSLYSDALREAKSLAAIADKENSDRAARIRDSHALQRASIPGFMVAAERLAEFLSPEQLAAERARMESEGPSIGAWQSASRMLGVEWDAPPPHINIEVPGEMGFPVDRRVWQAAVFALFIRSNRSKSFSFRATAKWCIQTFGWRSEFAVLHRHEHLLTPHERETIPSASRAVSAYFRVLEERGFISRSGGDRCTILRRSAFIQSEK